MRICFVMNIPSPYRLHTFNMLWAECQRRGHNLHVHFMNKGHKDRPSSWLNPKINFPHTIWRNLGPDQHEFNPVLVWRLLRARGEWIHLGSPFDTFTCILLALFCRTSVLCAGCEGNTKTPGVMSGIKGWFKRFIFARCPYATVPGADGAQYISLHQSYTKKKMPQTILLPNLVDERRFKPRELWKDSEMERIRRELDVSPGERLCIIPARLEPVKGLLPFVELLSEEMLAGWKIVIMGQGSLRKALISLVNSKGLNGKVGIKDYARYEDMPGYYAAADLLLLPSVYDPNPLSLIEALHSGLPLAASDQCGNIDEAVSDGRNGWILPVKETNRFKEVLVDVFSAPLSKLRAMGERSLSENATYWQSEKAIARYLDEVEEAYNKMI